MDSTILVLLGLSVAIIVLAVLLSWIFRKSRAKDRAMHDLNSDRHDGRGTATWIGIRRTGDLDDPNH